MRILKSSLYFSALFKLSLWFSSVLVFFWVLETIALEGCHKMVCCYLASYVLYPWQSSITHSMAWKWLVFHHNCWWAVLFLSPVWIEDNAGWFCIMDMFTINIILEAQFIIIFRFYLLRGAISQLASWQRSCLFIHLKAVYSRLFWGYSNITFIILVDAQFKVAARFLSSAGFHWPYGSLSRLGFWGTVFQ